MTFISRLYFNIFKHIGNLRLLFVVSCLFAGVCLAVVFVNTIDNVYFYKLSTEDSFMSPPYSESIYKFKQEDGERVSYYKAIAPIVRLCEEGQSEQAYNEAKSFVNVGEGKELSSPSLLCNRAKPRSEIIYSFSYLWNFLWVIFWFYFPFLIVFPIKFVIDGYKQDKRSKK